MSKYLSLSLIIIYNSLFSLSCAQRTFQKEGVVQLNDYPININDSEKSSAINQEYRIWFKDSMVIYEMKMIIHKVDHTKYGVLKKTTYDVFKYTFLNLKNLLCLDYNNFSDTALPVSKYFLKPEEAIGWKFYANKNIRDITDKTITVADTIIQGQTYKRIRTVNMFGGGFEYEYFLNCNTKNNIFHINRTLDEKFPNCKVTRSEIIDLNSPRKQVFEFKIAKEKLNTNENAIFKKWLRDSDTTTLPAISLDEALKKMRIPL